MPMIIFGERGNKQEIDLIEERDGALYAYEIKWKPQQVKIPKHWLEHYGGDHFSVIHPDNYLDYVG